jgi:DNA-binding XRE family transcriptional regulator/predicted RNase H-like HicB family nuclease
MSYEGYYSILIKDPDSGTILVSFPDHPHINTFGEDRDQAAAMAEDALNETLIVEFERGMEVPKESKRPRATKGREVVFVPLRPAVQMAFLMRKWRSEAGMTQKKMATALGISYQSYQRMERPGRANLTVAMLNRVAQVLGKRAVIEMRKQLN